MVYEYNTKVVNQNKVDDFYKDCKFVGYILSDGTFFQCKDHNVSDANTFVWLYLMLLDKDYDQKEELLNEPTNNKLLKLIRDHLRMMSHDEIHALYTFVNDNEIFISDLLVSYFGCHLITRLKKEILTAEINYYCFYNYLLNDFKITNVGRLVYDSNTKEFKYFYPPDRNDNLYDEIRNIKEEAGDENIELFYKTR